MDICDIPGGVTKKVLVSIDEALLRRVDRLAHQRRLSRSAYLSELAARDAQRAAERGSDGSIRRALARLDDLFASAPPGESSVEIRAGRDAR